MKFFSVITLFIASVHAAVETTITIANGDIVGLANDLGSVFRGVPYAAPPVGNGRFAAPAPSTNWNSPLDCTLVNSLLKQILVIIITI